MSCALPFHVPNWFQSFYQRGKIPWTGNSKNWLVLWWTSRDQTVVCLLKRNLNVAGACRKLICKVNRVTSVDTIADAGVPLSGGFNVKIYCERGEAALSNSVDTMNAADDQFIIDWHTSSLNIGLNTSNSHSEESSFLTTTPYRLLVRTACRRREGTLENQCFLWGWRIQEMTRFSGCWVEKGTNYKEKYQWKC